MEGRPTTAFAVHHSTHNGASGGARGDAVVAEFRNAMSKSKDLAVAVAAIKALTWVIRNSNAQTIMGLERELKEAAAALQKCDPMSISLVAGCQLFLRYTTRTSAIETDDFATVRSRLIERGEHFAETSNRARATIAEVGASFIRTNCTVLTHGHSRVVIALLKHAAAQGKQFSVIVTEGRPDNTGIETAKELVEHGVPVRIVLDSALAYMMSRIDMVLVGAEGVVESGGIINKVGTYQIAVLARAMHKPVYVAAESYKFARYYPLNQEDLGVPETGAPVDFGPLLPKGVQVINPPRDYTPPANISMLFTDLGVLTPAAVSDELIQLYV